MSRAVSTNELLTTSFKLFPFEEKWRRMMGTPERNGVIFIWGDSANGKTRFVLQLAKYLASFAKIDYNSLEEGKCYSQQVAWQENSMHEVAGRIVLLDKMNIEDLDQRLSKKRAAKVVVIDSWQYARISFRKFIDLKARHPTVLWIIISQEHKKKPKGLSADDVRFDAMVKVYIQGFVAFSYSRFGGNMPYVIWEEGARRAYGDKMVDKYISDFNK